MTVTLLDQRREKRERDQSLESRVSALENYIAMLIGTGEIADGAITTPKILNGAVAELKIAAGAVTAAKTAVAGIDSSTGNVTANHIIAGMIQTNAITAVKINASAVTADKIATNAVTAVKIYASAVTADKIASNAITAVKINANAVTADKINVSTLSAISANIGAITAGTITGVTITGGTVQTSTSGQRIVMSSDVISIYSSSGSAGAIQGFYTGGVNYVNFTGPIQVDGEIVSGNNTRPSATGVKNLGSNSFFWNDVFMHTLKFDYESACYISQINDAGNSYIRFKFNSGGGNVEVGRTFTPYTANTYNCGTATKYWARVYSDAYFTKNTTFQTFDKYDDLQILRDLKFDKNDKLVLKNLPKEIHDKGFINFGGMTSFNLCASRKIVECVDDLKSEIDKLKLKLTKLERQVI